MADSPESNFRLGSPLYEEARDRYLGILSPLFFPRDPLSHDIIRYFSSLLRVSGMEDRGWDPHAESRALLEDFNTLAQMPLSTDDFSDEFTILRLGLVLYNHILEMSAPYDVIANLLRFKLQEGYSSNPFHKYLDSDQRKRAKRYGLGPRQKVAVIQELSERSGVPVFSILDEFIHWDFRNSIAHSDFTLSRDSFRSRGATLGASFEIPLADVDRLITSAKAFISAFFILEGEARRSWGGSAGRAVPYDPTYKGLMEVLVDGDGLMNGFKVHWPNGGESYYRRTSDGIEMVNCFLSLKRETVELFVGMYARHADDFSPLVERGAVPRYTPVEGSDEPAHWDFDGAAAKQGLLPEVIVSVHGGSKSADPEHQ